MIASTDIAAFLDDYKLMSLRLEGGTAVILEGVFSFSAVHKDFGEIRDRFELRIVVPPGFPRAIPAVFETANRIPRDGNYHINKNDHSFCLGSPLVLLQKIAKDPTLVGFVGSCIVPYLFAVAHKLKSGGTFPFGELAHGTPGALDEYVEVFGLEDRAKLKQALALLGKRKRIANKLPCPCGCGKRLGICEFNRRLLPLRNLASPSWFRLHTNSLRGPLHSPPPSHTVLSEPIA